MRNESSPTMLVSNDGWMHQSDSRLKAWFTVNLKQQVILVSFPICSDGMCHIMAQKKLKTKSIQVDLTQMT
jgi:hypothetical protein